MNLLPVNTISATIDGVDMDFKTNVHATLYTDHQIDFTTSLNIQGSTATVAPAGGIGITVSSTNPGSITKGTYTIANAKNTPPVWVQLNYGYYDPASNGPDQPYITDPNGIQPTTITITSINSTNVQGTFSGTLTYPQNNASTKTVSNGRFNVTISN